MRRDQDVILNETLTGIHHNDQDHRRLEDITPGEEIPLDGK